MLDYKKILDRFVLNYPHEIAKIKEIVATAAEAGQNNVAIPFEDIIKSKVWDSEEKAELLRFFGYSKRNHSLNYTDKTNSKRRVGAYYYTIANNDFASFEALMITFGDIESHYVEGYGQISEIRRLRDIIIDIESCCSSIDVSKYLTVVLDNISEAAIRSIMAPRYEGYSYTSVRNKSSMSIIIASQDLELIKRCLTYVDDINIYLNDAVATGNIEIVKYFLELGADVNYEPEEVILGVLSPLKTAIVHNNLEMVTFLVENGADVNRDNKNSNFIDRLNSHQVEITGRISDCEPASEKDTGVKINRLTKEASPMELATKLLPGKHVLYPGFHMSQREVAYLIGKFNDVENSLSNSQEKSERRAIIEYLYGKVSDVNSLDYTDLIAFTFITKNIDDFKKYTKYAKDNNIPLDFDRLFELFFVFYIEYEKDFLAPILDFIASYDQDNDLYLKCFEYYMKKRRAISPAEFYTSDFSKALLSKIPEEKRKEICLMPYCKNLRSVKALMDLGFDLGQVDADGRNILFYFFLTNKRNSILDKDAAELCDYLLENVDLSIKDKKGKTALYYAMQSFPTEEEALYARPERVCTLSGREQAVVSLISKMPTEAINQDDVNCILERRIEHLSGYGDAINYAYVYQHHAELFGALAAKGVVLSSPILKEIFGKLYPKDSTYANVLERKINLGSSLDFVYEKLDLNTDIQDLDIEKEYNNLLTRLNERTLPFEEFITLFADFYRNILSLKSFYEESIQKKFSPEKYMDYAVKKYNTKYTDLDAYVLLIIIRAIRKYGSIMTPNILDVCPDFNINSYLVNADAGLNYWEYVAQISDMDFDDEGEPIYGDEHFDAQNITPGWNEGIVFTGGLMQYAILIDDLQLVQYLLQRGASMHFSIDDEDYTWAYVNSKTMLQYMESVLGSREYSDLEAEERAFYLSLLGQDDESPENPPATLKR